MADSETPDPADGEFETFYFARLWDRMDIQPITKWLALSLTAFVLAIASSLTFLYLHLIAFHYLSMILGSAALLGWMYCPYLFLTNHPARGDGKNPWDGQRAHPDAPVSSQDFGRRDSTDEQIEGRSFGGVGDRLYTRPMAKWLTFSSLIVLGTIILSIVQHFSGSELVMSAAIALVYCGVIGLCYSVYLFVTNGRGERGENPRDDGPP